MEASAISELKRQAKEYESKLRRILRMQDSNMPLIEKQVVVQRLRNEVIEEYSKVFGNDLKRKIDEHLSALKQESIVVDTEDDSFDLRDVIKDKYNPNWLALSMLSRGSLYFFAARAKSGKTDFMNYLVRCIVSQDEFLGTPCINGNVLWYHLEESKGSIQMKAKRHGFRELYQNNVNRGNVTIVRSLDLVNDFVKMERQVKELKPVLVIIDTVRAAMSRSGLDERNANYADIFYRVQAMAIQQDVTVICLHHTIKKQSSGESGDVLDSMSGTSKMSGIGEGTIILERSKDAGSSRAFLHFITRDIGRKKIEIDRRKEFMGSITYNFVEEHGVSIDRNLCYRILHHILDSGEISHTSLFNHFIQNPETQMALESLIDSNLIDYDHVHGEFYYSVPEASKHLWRRSIERLCAPSPKQLEKQLNAIQQIDSEYIPAPEEPEPEGVKLVEPDKPEKTGMTLETEIKSAVIEQPKPKFHGRVASYEDKPYMAAMIEQRDNEFWYRLRHGKGKVLEGLVPESKLTECSTNNQITTKQQ